MNLLAALAFALAGAGSAPQPERIVSLSPNLTEILHGLGAFSRVVAVSDYCFYPPEVERLPRVGGWMSTNLEQVASLRPDLVVMSDAQAPFVQDRLAALGLPTLVVKGQSLSDVFVTMAELGRAVGSEPEAEALALRTRAQLEEVRRRTANLSRPRVLCVVDRMPGTLRDLYVATQGSYLTELIEAAGGEPIAPPAGSNYTKVSIEAVIAFDPQVIIDMVQGAKGSLGEKTLAVWKELPDVRAVREGRVHSLRDSRAIHPSQFVGDTARLFGELIHPKAFGK